MNGGEVFLGSARLLQVCGRQGDGEEMIHGQSNEVSGDIWLGGEALTSKCRF